MSQAKIKGTEFYGDRAMSKNLAYMTAGVLTVLMSAGPAFAEISVPEPATMTLFGAGALAAVVVNRFRRRK